jgi:hypothetical protein
MWAELHARALDYAGDLAAEEKWLEDFRARIGCGSCREHWYELLGRMPPDLSGPITYWVWTVRAHNVVSRQIGKAAMDLGAAMQLILKHYLAHA